MSEWRRKMSENAFHMNTVDKQHICVSEQVYGLTNSSPWKADDGEGKIYPWKGPGLRATQETEASKEEETGCKLMNVFTLWSGPCEKGIVMGRAWHPSLPKMRPRGIPRTLQQALVEVEVSLYQIPIPCPVPPLRTLWRIQSTAPARVPKHTKSMKVLLRQHL
jgi:hypothetical protein